MTSPSKRTATIQAHANLNAANHSLHPSVPDDLATRLRNLGSRIRKNVTEGYTTSPSPHASPAKSADIFQSAKDTLHEVFHSKTTPPVSPRKRRRSDTEKDDDSDMEVEDELPSLDTRRPIKPLKRVNRAPKNLRNDD